MPPPLGCFLLPAFAALPRTLGCIPLSTRTIVMAMNGIGSQNSLVKMPASDHEENKLPRGFSASTGRVVKLVFSPDKLAGIWSSPPSISAPKTDPPGCSGAIEFPGIDLSVKSSGVD
ncbi:hypothetical protein R3P38DRAFT_2775525 [Favolaschia claudopus]|uniref:Secreted protein n=1 Tax=Favolaschia claudopus TaxID=2862362 RepID=A0AAV9ZXC0_9AGAR